MMLKELQSNEVARRTEAIATRVLSASSVSSITLPAARASTSVPISVQTPTTTQIPTVSSLTTGGSVSCLCIDCLVITTSHRCRRCRQYVCDLCCSTGRELEMCGGVEIVLTMKVSQPKISFALATTIQMETNQPRKNMMQTSFY